RLYADTTLDELVASGQKTNADMRLAAARVQEAEGALREARAAFWPDVTAGYSFTRSRASASGVPPPPAGTIMRPSHQLPASTNVALDFWGRFAPAPEAAQANGAGHPVGQD